MRREWLRLQWLSVLVQFKFNTAEEGDELAALRLALSDKNSPVRDANGFRKLIVVLTATGKAMALHTGDGRVVWSRHLPQGVAPTVLYG